tara:strand:+ start:115 stop:675 length:561 start_codon:yes stop_codon:yes gene_type:complete
MNKKLGYIIVITFWFVILSLVSSCSLTSYYVDPIYEDHPHTTEVYWVTDYDTGNLPYFGYWKDFWYYYGVPHYYPWWYYYQYLPPQYYYAQWHINVHCDNGHYVYGHRGPTFNNQVQKDFRPTIKIKNNKDKSFVFPRDWKSSNSTKINKQNYNRTFNYNSNNTINKGNNGSTRPNKTNTTRKPKR